MAQPHPPSHPAAHPQAPAGQGGLDPHAMAELFAKIDRWRDGKLRLRKLLADDIAHPGRSQFDVFHILPGANMSEASKELGLFDSAMQRLAAAEAELRAPAFAHLPHEQQERAAKHVQSVMEVVRRHMANTAAAIGNANRAVSGRDAAIAQGGMNASKFVIEQAPDVMGMLVTAITHNKALGDTVKNASKVGLRGISEVVGKGVGAPQDVLDKELGSFRDVAIDAVVDEVVGRLASGAEASKIKTAVIKLVVKPVLQAAAAAAKNDKGTAAERKNDAKEAAEKAFADGVNELVKDAHLPKLGNLKKVLEPVVAAVLGGVQAKLDGKPVKDGVIDALKQHGHDALVDKVGERLDHRGHHDQHEHHAKDEHHGGEHHGAGHQGGEGHQSSHHAPNGHPNGQHAAAHPHGDQHHDGHQGHAGQAAGDHRHGPSGQHGAAASHADAHQQHGGHPAPHSVAAHPTQVPPGGQGKRSPSPAHHDWVRTALKVDTRARRRA